MAQIQHNLTNSNKTVKGGMLKDKCRVLYLLPVTYILKSV